MKPPPPNVYDGEVQGKERADRERVFIQAITGKLVPGHIFSEEESIRLCKMTRAERKAFIAWHFRKPHGQPAKVRRTLPPGSIPPEQA